jgi:hypothetical protein
MSFVSSHCGSDADREPRGFVRWPARSRQSIDPCATPAEPVRASRWALHLDRLRLVPSQCLRSGERFLRAYPLSIRPRLSSSLELLQREHAALYNGVLGWFANAWHCSLFTSCCRRAWFSCPVRSAFKGICFLFTGVPAGNKGDEKANLFLVRNSLVFIFVDSSFHFI